MWMWHICIAVFTASTLNKMKKKNVENGQTQTHTHVCNKLCPATANNKLNKHGKAAGSSVPTAESINYQLRI